MKHVAQSIDTAKREKESQRKMDLVRTRLTPWPLSPSLHSSLHSFPLASAELLLVGGVQIQLQPSERWEDVAAFLFRVPVHKEVEGEESEGDERKVVVFAFVRRTEEGWRYDVLKVVDVGLGDGEVREVEGNRIALGLGMS